MSKMEKWKSKNTTKKILIIAAIILMAVAVMVIVLLREKEQEVSKWNSEIDNSYSTITPGTWDISADDGVSNVTATLTADGVLTISGSGAMKNFTIDPGNTWQNYMLRPWRDYVSLIKQVNIKEGVTNIGVDAFMDCTGVTEIVIPEGVTELEGDVFAGCTNLIKVVIPSTVTWIGAGCFFECESLTQIIVNDNNKSYCDADGVLYRQYYRWKDRRN